MNGGEAVDDTRGGGDTRDDGVATREVAANKLFSGLGASEAGKLANYFHFSEPTGMAALAAAGDLAAADAAAVTLVVIGVVRAVLMQVPLFSSSLSRVCGKVDAV